MQPPPTARAMPSPWRLLPFSSKQAGAAFLRGCLHAVKRRGPLNVGGTSGERRATPKPQRNRRSLHGSYTSRMRIVELTPKQAADHLDDLTELLADAIAGGAS